MTRTIACNGIIREKNTKSPGRCTDETNEPTTARPEGKEREKEREGKSASGATKERRTERQKSSRGEKQPAAFVRPSRGSLSRERAADKREREDESERETRREREALLGETEKESRGT